MTRSQTKRANDVEGPRRTSRRRKVAKIHSFEVLENKEAQMMQEALKASMATFKTVSLDEIPESPEYHPTEEEFRDPMVYIQKIRPKAEQFGVVRIVPPASWKPPKPLVLQCSSKFKTRLQILHRMQEAIGFDDGKLYTVAEYKEMADAFLKKTLPEHGRVSSQDIERLYWDTVNGSAQNVEVEYGNDIDSRGFGSGFPVEHSHEYTSHPWNLNNFASLPGSVIRNLNSDISGVNAPWVYFGMLFSSFCWHAEDLWMYSVNYNHFGAHKIWYGCPGSYLYDFEQVIREQLPDLFRKEPDLMLKLVTMISPTILAGAGVPIYKTVQREGDFVITFPKSYHAGYNEGFNCTEAVNFATEDWISHGFDALEEYRKHSRRSVFSLHKLLLDVAIESRNRRFASPQIVSNLQAVIVEEKHLRNQVKRFGLQKWVSCPPNSDVPSQEPPICFLCQQFCHLSYATCSCDSERIACLNHVRQICDCRTNMLCGHERFSLQDLGDVVEALQQ